MRGGIQPFAKGKGCGIRKYLEVDLAGTASWATTVRAVRAGSGRVLIQIADIVVA